MRFEIAAGENGERLQTDCQHRLKILNCWQPELASITVHIPVKSKTFSLNMEKIKLEFFWVAVTKEQTKEALRLLAIFDG